MFVTDTPLDQTTKPRADTNQELPNYFVVSGVAIIAIGVTIAWWSKNDISIFFANAEIRRGQLWRLFTAIFPHVDILHLAFNIYWLWVFGTVIERTYGHAKTALLVLFLGVGSSAMDFALDQGGVGLSGVGYGLFGFLWIISTHDQRFRDVISKRTIWLFVGWFFFCIVTTVTRTHPVANVAHAAGALLGALTGYAVIRPDLRRLVVAAIMAILVFGIWGSTIGRPFINLSGRAGYEEGRWGYDALMANHNQEAIRWLRDAVRYQPKSSIYWFDLGIAYHRVGDLPAAVAAYRRAHELEPGNPKYSEAAQPE